MWWLWRFFFEKLPNLNIVTLLWFGPSFLRYMFLTSPHSLLLLGVAFSDDSPSPAGRSPPHQPSLPFPFPPCRARAATGGAWNSPTTSGRMTPRWSRSHCATIFCFFAYFWALFTEMKPWMAGSRSGYSTFVLPWRLHLLFGGCMGYIPRQPAHQVVFCTGVGRIATKSPKHTFLDCCKVWLEFGQTFRPQVLNGFPDVSIVEGAHVEGTYPRRQLTHL